MRVEESDKCGGVESASRELTSSVRQATVTNNWTHSHRGRRNLPVLFTPLAKSIEGHPVSDKGTVRRVRNQTRLFVPVIASPSVFPRLLLA